MKLSQEAKSRYYKGLLVLLRRDRIVHSREKDLMLKIGEILGFDKRFCEATIDELLSNANITREPIFFPDEIVKECFFRDAVRLALVDGNFHPTELRWLRTVAHLRKRIPCRITLRLKYNSICRPDFKLRDFVRFYSARNSFR
jgi:hypothetical protein